MAIDTPPNFESASPLSVRADEARRAASPGVGWLIGWVALLWLSLLGAPILIALLYRSFFPEAETTTSMPWTREWVWQVGRYVGHLALVRGAAGAVAGVAFGLTAFALLRRHVVHARWLPLLGAVGLAAGESNGVIVSMLVSLQEQGALWISDPDRFLIRQTLIQDSIAGAGLAMGLGVVLRRQLPRYGWWVGACAFSFAIWKLVGTLILARDVGPATFGLVSLFVAIPLASLMTGGSMLVLLRLRERDLRLAAQLPDLPESNQLPQKARVSEQEAASYNPGSSSTRAVPNPSARAPGANE